MPYIKIRTFLNFVLRVVLQVQHKVTGDEFVSIVNWKGTSR